MRKVYLFYSAIELDFKQSGVLLAEWCDGVALNSVFLYSEGVLPTVSLNSRLKYAADLNPNFILISSMLTFYASHRGYMKSFPLIS